MFICAVTGKVSKPREPMIRVVTETRPVMYSNYVPDPEDEDGERLIEKISKGNEIVKEVGCTKEGYDELMRRKDVNYSL